MSVACKLWLLTAVFVTLLCHTGPQGNGVSCETTQNNGRSNKKVANNRSGAPSFSTNAKNNDFEDDDSTIEDELIGTDDEVVEDSEVGEDDQLDEKGEFGEDDEAEDDEIEGKTKNTVNRKESAKKISPKESEVELFSKIEKKQPSEENREERLEMPKKISRPEENEKQTRNKSDKRPMMEEDNEDGDTSLNLTDSPHNIKDNGKKSKNFKNDNAVDENNNVDENDKINRKVNKKKTRNSFSESGGTHSQENNSIAVEKNDKVMEEENRKATPKKFKKKAMPEENDEDREENETDHRRNKFVQKERVDKNRKAVVHNEFDKSRKNRKRNHKTIMRYNYNNDDDTSSQEDCCDEDDEDDDDEDDDDEDDDDEYDDDDDENDDDDEDYDDQSHKLKSSFTVINGRPKDIHKFLNRGTKDFKPDALDFTKNQNKKLLKAVEKIVNKVNSKNSKSNLTLTVYVENVVKQKRPKNSKKSEMEKLLMSLMRNIVMPYLNQA